MRPYYEQDGIVIYHGDALDILPDLADGSIPTIIGDPPYCSGGRQQSQARGVLAKANGRRGTWFLTDNMGTDSYIWWMRQFAGQFFRLAEVGAHLYCFTDWRQYANLVTAIETKGWALKSVVVWDKAKGGAMGSFWRNNHEWIPVFTKGPPRPLPDGSFFNTWQGVKPQDDEHATVKPTGLIQYLARAGSIGPILDPWIGSGTTLFAAKELRIPAIGIESVEAYCEIAARRLDQGVLELPLT